MLIESGRLYCVVCLSILYLISKIKCDDDWGGGGGGLVACYSAACISQIRH